MHSFNVCVPRLLRKAGVTQLSRTLSPVPLPGIHGMVLSKAKAAVNVKGSFWLPAAVDSLQPVVLERSMHLIGKLSCPNSRGSVRQVDSFWSQ